MVSHKVLGQENPEPNGAGEPNGKRESPRSLLPLCLGALGVVYGDIGTSVLYTLSVTFFRPGVELERSLGNVLGALSCIFWSLMLVVTVKYTWLVMRADNNGQGGIFALLALLRGHYRKEGAANSGHLAGWITIAVIIGAALLYGDGVITPVITTLSAIEGLEVIMPACKPLIIPIALGILVGLFAIQSRGTEKIGRLFGPIMVVWFLAIAAMAVPAIVRHPMVLAAVNPLHALRFLIAHGVNSLYILGAVVLCVTGGEALYADMGHFGKRPIRLAWMAFVLPSLLCNYFGQGARLLDAEPIAGNHLFYAIVPYWGLIPMVGLATLATIIASQALISGAYSLTQQSIGLGLLPRLKIIHTNRLIEGQIYMPFVNWMLCLGCAVLTMMFQHSTSLATAYGIAVTGTMAITTLTFYAVATTCWGWNRTLTGIACFALGGIDLMFFAANTLKFIEGGWVPIAIAAALTLIMLTWQWGREQLKRAYNGMERWDVRRFITERQRLLRMPRHEVYLTLAPVREMDDKLPVNLQISIDRYGAVAEMVTFVTVIHIERPFRRKRDRVKTIPLGEGVRSIITYWGYMELPQLAKIIDAEIGGRGGIRVGEEYLFYDREPLPLQILARLFATLARFSSPAHAYFGLGAQYRRLIKELVPVHIGRHPTVLSVSN